MWERPTIAARLHQLWHRCFLACLSNSMYIISLHGEQIDPTHQDQ